MKNKYHIKIILLLTMLLIAISNIAYSQSSSFGNTYIFNNGEMGIVDIQHNFFKGGLGIQPGIVGTDRTSTQGFLSFVGTASWTGASDTAFVDGYVKTYMTSPFTFPIGDNGKYRPAAISNATLSNPANAAYYNVSATTAITSRLRGGNEPTLPASGPFNTALKGVGVGSVDDVEYWDINGATPTKITLTWDANSVITTLSSLSILGWNGTHWEAIGSSVDITSLLGGTSNLISGSITTKTDLIPNKYDVYTLGTIFNTDPDITGALVNVSVSGNVSTNDDVPVGTTYGNPISDPSNPSACVPVMSSTGSYTFICSTPGEYEYQIPVCAPGQTSNCPTELLKITITDPGVVTAGPSVNPDVMTTLQNMPTTLNVLSNDACNNGPSCTLSNPTITDQPNNGTVVVNANGTLTYTPNSTFVGTDTIMYATCDNQSPSKCDTTFIIVSVNPTGAANTTSANEDYVNAKGNAPVSGNVLANDTDPEGNTQTVAPQNITNSQGTLVLNANGTYTFTAAAGYSGSVQFTYTVCDNGTPSACDTATLHILVLPPDVTINLTMTPNVMLGITTFNATVKVTELNSVNTNGTITVRIPKDSRVTFTYNSALTALGFTDLNNNVWTYNGTNPFFHLFTTTSVITAGGSSTFGFVGSFDPLNTNGKYTVTSTISSGSGSETKKTNNNDSELIDYFHN